MSSETTTMPGINLGLARITALLTALKSPHLSQPIIHIAGTNGKGSISAYLSSILRQSPSLKIGRFNSPHLVDEWDCLETNGRRIDQVTYDTVKRHVMSMNELGKIGASSFEILTATAFSIFAATKPSLDLAIVEVGMGGSTDATNVVPSDKTLLSIISSIELDHQKFLGDTLEEIAAVKGGIIKERSEVVVAHQHHPEVDRVMEEIVKATESTVYFAGVATRLFDSQMASIPLTALRQIPSSTHSTAITTPAIEAKLPLPGSYQLANCSAAVLAVQILRSSPRIQSLLPQLSRINDTMIQEGIKTTNWPGRLDWIKLPHRSQRILIDGAHNPSSAILLAEYMESLERDSQPTTLILGLSFPRPPATILEPLLRNNGAIKRIICVRFQAPASMEWINATDTKDIAEAARGLRASLIVEECETVAEALELTREERCVVAGSLYLAADVYRLQRKLAA
jgi:folylpolyglutamate synthase/dihydrofolate synthase